MNDQHGLDVDLLSQYLRKHFHDIKPIKVVGVQVKSAVTKGNNYASDVYRVKLDSVLASGRKKTLSMIVKNELKSEQFQEIMTQFPVFRTEIKVYTTIFPLMEELMEEFEDKREKLWPNMYGFEPYSMVAFEDLSDKQYAVAERRNCLDLKHSLLVIRNLARFHAMSKVLLSRGLITQEDKGKMGFSTADGMMKNWWVAVFTTLSDAMLNKWGDEWSTIAERLKDEMLKVPEKTAQLSKNYDQRFEVLNHGDLWTCNMLFRYMEHEHIPVSVKLIDFQMCNLNSFIWDIEYFMNTSTIPHIRRTHKNDLYDAYQQALEMNLKFFNYSGYVPTLEDVKAESKRIEYVKLCLIPCNSLMCAETESAIDMDKIMTHTPEEVIHESVFSDGKALRGIGDDLKYFYETGIF